MGTARCWAGTSPRPRSLSGFGKPVETRTSTGRLPRRVYFALTRASTLSSQCQTSIATETRGGQVAYITALLALYFG
jgi:hypothetical protein